MHEAGRKPIPALALPNCPAPRRKGASGVGDTGSRLFARMVPGAMRIVMVGPFGLSPRMTMRARAFQLARHLVARGHAVRMVMPPLAYSRIGRPALDRGRRRNTVCLLIPFRARSVGDLHHTTAAAQALAHQPDVVHVFKPIGHAGVAAWVATPPESARHAEAGSDRRPG